MSVEYDDYLARHRSNVKKGLLWLIDHFPEIGAIVDQSDFDDHDRSKDNPEEYHAYDAYFYSRNRSNRVVKDFEYAWLEHIHQNRHHWQHWVLHHDEPDEPVTVLDMPYWDVVEMICDWWSFSWASGNLYKIFDWYEEHKTHMLLSKKTRTTVETILENMREKLDEEAKGADTR